MLKELDGKVAVITGGSEGYGRSTAERLIQAGCKVIITGRSLEKLKDAKKSIKEADVFRADATKDEDWDALEKYVVGKYRKIDILINNAGAGISIKETVDQSVDDIDSIIRTNLTGTIYGCRKFGKMMRDVKSGLIINLSSVCAKKAWPGWSVYAAAKAGVLSFSKGLYVEMQPYNVRVTCLIPGAGASSFSKNSGLPDTNFKLRSEDIAQCILNICTMPEHVVIEEMTVWGIDQQVIPL